MTRNSPLIVIVGPTGIGKSALSLYLAGWLPCEVVSADSRQIYKGLDIGTAKVTEEEQGGIKHYLIDIRDPDEQYDAASFVDDALAAEERRHDDRPGGRFGHLADDA